MVNWAPKLQTAVSDLEVEYSDEPDFCFTSSTRWKDTRRITGFYRLPRRD